MVGEGFLKAGRIAAAESIKPNQLSELLIMFGGADCGYSEKKYGVSIECFKPYDYLIYNSP